MKAIRFIIVLNLWCFGTSLLAQGSMQEGFDLLEKGQYAHAVTFFDTYLKADAGNRTARLCLGRAVGLNGAPEKARSIFSELLEEYPGDLELEMNYAESLLWAGRYTEAAPYYRGLMEQHPGTFGLTLGYANTLSNLKEYRVADSVIARALDLEPAHASALTSRKYIWLGWAYQAIQQQHFTQAKKVLDNLKKNYPSDQNVHRLFADYFLQNRDFTQARNSYATLEQLGDTLVSRRGMALSWQQQGRPARAMEWAEKAWELVKDTKAGSEGFWPAWERYVQALIWNRRYASAGKALDVAAETAPIETHAALRAMLGMYTGNFKTSIMAYRQILGSDSTSFDGRLGLANALLASGQIRAAYKAGLAAQEQFPGQPDVTAFLEKVRQELSPSVMNTSGMSFDNGNNQAFFNSITAELPLSARWKAAGTYGERHTENRLSTFRAQTYTSQVQLSYRLLPTVALEGQAGLMKAVLDSSEYLQPELRFGVKFQPFRRQHMEVFYQRSIQNFNAELIARNIRMDQFGSSYHLSTNFGLGWFGQGIYQNQSDGNSSMLLFTSLYLEPLTKPVLKAGVNFQYLGFQEQRPLEYFSPLRYTSWDGFAEYRPNLGRKTRLYLQVASGYQRIEAQPVQALFRAKAEISRVVWKQLEATLFGSYSSQASSTAGGFEFTQTGLRLGWKFKSPAFNPDFALEQVQTAH